MTKINSMKKVFDMLNRINHTPSISNKKSDSQIRHREIINGVLTSVRTGEKRNVKPGRNSRQSLS